MKNNTYNIHMVSPISLNSLDYVMKFIAHSSKFSPKIFSRYLKGNIINGSLIAEDIREEIKLEIERIAAFEQNKIKRLPHLSVILIGNDSASVVYVRNKAKAAQKTGKPFF